MPSLGEKKEPASTNIKRYLELFYREQCSSGYRGTKKLVIAERDQFYNCIQRKGQSVSTFTANLKHHTSTCNFGTHLNEALRDPLACGLRNKEIQKKH